MALTTRIACFNFHYIFAKFPALRIYKSAIISNIKTYTQSLHLDFIKLKYINRADIMQFTVYMKVIAMVAVKSVRS